MRVNLESFIPLTKQLASVKNITYILYHKKTTDISYYLLIFLLNFTSYLSYG